MTAAQDDQYDITADASFNDVEAEESPLHPGRVLQEEFLEPMKLSQYRLAKSIGVPPRRINEIVLGKRAITADTALRLSRYFGIRPEFWMNLQTRYELDVTEEAIGARLDDEVDAV